jgi:hypothetical protein
MSDTNNVITTGQSQVIAKYTFQEDTRFRPIVTNVRMLPRAGQAQVIEVTVLVDNPLAAPGFEASFTTVFTVALYDQAFEEYNIYGQRRSAETTEAKPRQEEF